MKKPLFLLATLLLGTLPATSIARKFTGNIGAGLAFNTDTHGMVTPLAQVGVTYHFDKISAGIEVNGMHIANNYRIFPSAPGIAFYDQELVYRGYSPRLFIKGSIAFGKIRMEYGIQGGFFHFINHRSNIPVPQPGGSYGIERKTKVQSTFGPIGGLVCSGIYPISKDVGIYLKFMPQYYRIDDVSKGIHIPLSAGLSVNLGKN